MVPGLFRKAKNGMGMANIAFRRETDSIRVRMPGTPFAASAMQACCSQSSSRTEHGVSRLPEAAGPKPDYISVTAGSTHTIGTNA